MALEVKVHERGEERRTTVGLFIAQAKLWLTADKTEVVEDGHPDAAHLYATPGTEIPIAEAERYGLTGKQRKPAQTKPRTPEGDKGGDGDKAPASDYAELDGKAIKAELTRRGIAFKPVGARNDDLRALLVADDAAKAAE